MWIRTKREMFDIIKRLADPRVLEDRVKLRKHIFSTYVWMRTGMLVIALAFPLVLWIVGGWLYGLQLQDSMSAYYWAPIKEGGDAPMRVWFVGLLFALGCCLLLYKGYAPLEDWALNIAGVCAICVALFPMCWKPVSECPSWSLHGFFAIVFFVLLALVAVLHALYALRVLRSRPSEEEDPPPRKGYATWYVVTGAVMVLAPVLTWIMFESNPARTFWVEIAGISAFCLFWGVQIVQIHRSDFDQDLA
jgi:succinate dehydrogenase/fumarate reductase cytochrome b subunit